MEESAAAEAGGEGRRQAAGWQDDRDAGGDALAHDAGEAFHVGFELRRPYNYIAACDLGGKVGHEW